MGWENNINGLSGSSSDFMRSFNNWSPKENYLGNSDFLMPTTQMNLGLPNLSTSAGPSTWFTDWFGKDGKMGYANTALDIGKGVFGMAMGLKQLGLANKQFDMQKQVTDLNMDMMKKNYNQTLEGKQRNMIAAMGQDAAAKQGILSVADQLKKYGA